MEERLRNLEWWICRRSGVTNSSPPPKTAPSSGFTFMGHWEHCIVLFYKWMKFGISLDTMNSCCVCGHTSIPSTTWTCINIWYNASKNVVSCIISSCSISGRVIIPTALVAFFNYNKNQWLKHKRMIMVYVFIFKCVKCNCNLPVLVLASVTLEWFLSQIPLYCWLDRIHR